MPAFIDLTGQKFGKLTVIERAKGVKDVQWVCRCECGNVTTVRPHDLKSGATKSCGCLRNVQYRKRFDLVGKIFGRLRVIRRNGSSKYKKALWLCKCDCGNKVTVIGNGLTTGKTNSCGCLRKDMATNKMTIHGLAKHKKLHPLYRVWRSIKDRTTNPNNAGWNNYGGRGIKMCKRWFNSFPNFLEDMGEKPSKKHSIDRIDNDGDYCPENCRWATRKEQNNNTRKSIFITIEGKTKTIKEWCNDYAIKYATALWRFNHGWPIDKIFFVKPYKGRNNHD